MAIPFIYKAGTNGRPASLTLQIDGKTLPVTSSHIAFESILKALKSGAWETVRKLVDFKSFIAKFTEGKVEIFQDSVHYDGKPLHNAICTRILDMLEKGFNVEPIGRFLDNLMQNPSESARDELYLFLEACNLPITSDGHFLAYKVVSHNYKDKHTGTMDNSVGATPKMNREDCNPNRNETCSSGLHFCSYSYVKSFRDQDSDRLMQIKVNPRDVVSIPSDYNNAKGRACQYYIESELIESNRIVDFYKPKDGETPKIINSVPTKADKDSTKNMQKQVNTSIKLDVKKVKEIKKMLKQGFSYSVIGAKFGVHRRTIGRIDTGEAWASVK